MIKSILAFFKIILHSILTGCRILINKSWKLKIEQFIIEGSSTNKKFSGNNIVLKIKTTNAIFIKAHDHLIPINKANGFYSIKLPVENGKNLLKVKIFGLFQTRNFYIETYNNSPEIIIPKNIKTTDLNVSALEQNLFSTLRINTDRQELTKVLNETKSPKLLAKTMALRMQIPSIKIETESLAQELNKNLN